MRNLDVPGIGSITRLRISMPLSSNALTAPNWSSRGPFGSIRYSCHKPICSTPRLRKLFSAWRIRYSGRPDIVHTSGPGRVRPALVATRMSRYGCSASRIKISDTSGPYESGVSTKSTPRSGRRFSVRIASARSNASPPHTNSSKAHRTKAKAVDLDLAADLEAVGFRRVWL
jgi:hypothetical protein